jgi:hypothetical protein
MRGKLIRRRDWLCGLLRSPTVGGAGLERQSDPLISYLVRGEMIVSDAAVVLDGGSGNLTVHPLLCVVSPPRPELDGKRNTIPATTMTQAAMMMMVLWFMLLNRHRSLVDLYSLSPPPRTE